MGCFETAVRQWGQARGGVGEELARRHTRDDADARQVMREGAAQPSTPPENKQHS